MRKYISMRAAVLLLLASPSVGRGQGGETIIPRLRHHIETLADDSMLGRPTPSPGLEKAAGYVARQFATMGLAPWPADSSYFIPYSIPGQLNGASSANVVAILRGSDPALQNTYIVLTAHLDGLGKVASASPGSDSILNGADDNASGVAALLEIARALSRSAEPTRRNILFAVVTGEEAGLWGSAFLISQSPLREGLVKANMNMDMVGRPRGDSVFLVTTEDPRTTRIVAEAAALHRNWGLTLLGRAELDQRYPGQKLEDRSDHANFVRREIPAVVIFTGLHEDYHGPGDAAEKIRYDALARIVRMGTDIAGALANASE